MEKRKFHHSCFCLGKAIKARILIIAMLFVHCQEKNASVIAKESTGPRTNVKNQRLRAPQPLENLLKELQAEPEGGFQDSHEVGEVGPFIGNAKMILDEPRGKKSCGISSVAAREIINPSLKRSYFAASPEEIALKQEEDEGRQKQEVKRSDFLGDGAFPWSCETEYKWKDMGQDHYPRFVRTAECKQPLCFNGFFRCKPRRYKTKVLRRLTEAEAAASCDDEDVSLPESLRDSWKFITVTINLCCDCSGRLPMAHAAS